MYKIDFSNPSSIYFVGIGGVSMCGLAELLAHAGFKVSGSDRAPSPLTRHLEEKGITVFYGQNYKNITDDIDCVVFTSAIHPDNPEYIAAHDKNLPCLTRGQLMGQVMQQYQNPIAISGTHGKTTTTSMLSQILLQADTDPTLFIGGTLKSIQGNVRIGSSGYFVTEACEYTNSFLSFYPRIGMILNIEEDHLDFFKDLDDIRASFHRFAQLLPADGLLIINADIPEYQEISADLPCQVITFSAHGDADYHCSDISYDRMGCATFTLHSQGHEDRQIKLSVPGVHNMANALAAIATADFLEIPTAHTQAALLSFAGPDRRFEYKGTIGGLTVIDDYAHHPTEIKSCLEAANGIAHNTLWCIFQPHTYTRTKSFLKEFAQALSLADRVVLADIYAARETNTLGISSEDLQKEILKLGKKCDYFPSFDEIENFLLENCTKGDLLITMGAGDVHKIGENLLGI